jgi:hypothetical protein
MKEMQDCTAEKVPGFLIINVDLCDKDTVCVEVDLL